MTKKTKHLAVQLGIFLISFFGRVLPHLPNMNPVLGVGVVAGSLWGRKVTLLPLLLSMVFSDIVLSLWSGYPAFGEWTLFTYSGMGFIFLLAPRLTKGGSKLKILGVVGGSSFGYWIWTNFGVWVMASQTHGGYAMSLDGLVACFAAALPFLPLSFFGDLVWAFLLLVAVDFLQEKKSFGMFGTATHRN
jgi:hypothetical protein